MLATELHQTPDAVPGHPMLDHVAKLMEEYRVEYRIDIPSRPSSDGP